LKELVSLTDKAATKVVIHKTKSSRYVSRFSKKLSDLSQSAGS
ncbi:MAG: 30S ribosomal protein S20, partial [Candidatus Dadabacteria bacterium]|nr:30S ribosomal protein S20 [Candidatus Dadabacteria bacterium]